MSAHEARSPFRAPRSAFCALRSAFRAPQSGQAIVEYAIVFPLQLMLTLGIVQMAQLFVAKQVLEYGAYCGARSALTDMSQDPAKVEENAKRAVLVPVSRITGAGGVGSDASIIIPGWGGLVNSIAAEQKTQVTITNDGEGSHAVIRCDVNHDYELTVPIGGELVYRLGDFGLSVPGFSADKFFDANGNGIPHLQMTTSCVLAHPWND